MNNKKKILIINACVNRDKSRTQRLGYALIERINKKEDYDIEEIVLENINLKPLNSYSLNERVDALANGRTDFAGFALAKQLTNADKVVILSPYWDLSFPSMLKVFIEHISIVGTTFYYNDAGIPIGLCKADKLYYVTTSGGFIPEVDFGFEYVKNLFSMLGISQAKFISAQGLDIINNNSEEILKTAINKIQNDFI